MEKLQIDKMKNSQFDKADSIYKRLTKLLIDCQAFEETEEYFLIKSKLSDVLGLIDKVRVKTIKDPI